MPSALLCALVVGLLTGEARADDALRSTLIDLLSGYEQAATADELRRLGPGVESELLVIADDPSMSRVRREAATYSLGWFPSETTRVWLQGRLADPSVDSHIRRSAAWALANGWQDSAVPDLSTAFADPDVQLRNQIARALGKVGTAAARAALEARLPNETDAMVRTTVQTLLAAK